MVIFKNNISQSPTVHNPVSVSDPRAKGDQLAGLTGYFWAL